MVRIRDSIVIDRPVEEVFDFVADQRNEPTYNPAMSECRLLTDEPVGKGSRFASTLRSRVGRLSMVSLLTAHERPHRLCSRTETAGTVVVGCLTFEALGGSTRLTWDWQMRPTRAMRLLVPFLLLSGARVERRTWTRLKRLMESGDGLA